MIPVKLDLYNFLAYQDPEPLDLTGLHLACLAGANGAGKSSLLDAITWSLWGKARTRRDDDLIHGDQEEMKVQLTFTLSGDSYRVTRYRSRKGRGTSLLDLEVADSGGWRSLSDATIRGTQARINDVLRLDYDTFINSAFLVQGRADEFTQKTPGERKAILGEILGLDRWATYEDRVKKALKTVEAEVEHRERELGRIDQELAREDEYRQELDDAQKRLEALNEQVAEAEDYVRELDSTRQMRESKQQQSDMIERHIARTQHDLEGLHQRRSKIAQRLDEYGDLIAARDEIEEGYAQLQDARQTERALSARLMEQSELRERQNDLQQRITAARSELQATQRSLRERQQELARQIDEGEDISAQLAEKQAAIAQLEALEAKKAEWENTLSDLRAEQATLSTANESLRAEMEAIRRQQEQIEDAQEPICPLCQQELSTDHRTDLLERLADEGNTKGEVFRANREQLKTINQQMSTLSEQVSQAEIELRNLPPLRDHVGRISGKIEQVTDAREEIVAVEERLTAITEQLDNEAYAEDAQAALAEVQAQLAELGYDETAHRAAQETIEAKAAYERKQADLEQVMEAQPEAEEELAGLDEAIATRNAELDDELAEQEAITKEIARLDEQVNDLQEWEIRRNDLKDQERQAHQRIGMIEQKINTLEQQRERRKELLKERAALDEQRGVYEELREAFSKNGIPAMIIEAAIPEIENEANELLARMTDGRMHVRFETQRENVTGGTRETLDIRIADELGTRDYETFSGGEAFRVDFAIRLALSRLLARRAGTQLRTLIMDEGFGTQDAHGRERLVQAINTIKDDFDLILVITHIDELKDAFPARIEVTKTQKGSIVEVI